MTVIGISGLGSIGRRHAKVFSSLGSVRLVGFDPVADSAVIGPHLWCRWFSRSVVRGDA